MNYSFDGTAGSSQSTVKPPLAFNTIHEVVFDGCEIKDVVGVKDPSQTYKQLVFKFSNDSGAYEHTLWEPKPDDFKRRETETTNKNGNKEKIPQPSNFESLMLFCKHLLDTLNPKEAIAIDKKEKKIGAANWDDFRTLIVKLFTPGKGTTTKIKLIKNSKDVASFPPYFASLTREGIPYVRNNFVGNKIGFSDAEVKKMKNNAAKPQSTQAGFDFAPPSGPPADDLDLSFDVNNI